MIPDSAPALPKRPGRRRFFMLDALRALAVLLVIVYHVFPKALPSGYLGVDLFFVLSGFLITRGLLSSTAALRLDQKRLTGQQVRGFFGQFYLKRVRRLFPAFAFMLLVVCSLALLSSPDVRVRLGRQVLGALTSTANWVQLATGSSYFDAGTPQLLKHMWSLAVEEQFYLLWPVVILMAAMVASTTMPKLRRRLIWGLLIAAVLSAVGMAVVFSVSENPNLAYLNTFTHASGLLLGAAVACMPLITLKSYVVRAVLLLVGFIGLTAGLVFLPEDFAGAQLGGIFGFSAAAAILVRLGTTEPLSLMPNELGWQKPINWIADRSYAMYLWHWPLVVLAASWFPDRNGGAVEPGLAALRAVVVLLGTLGMAEISFRLFEDPVLRRGFKGAWTGARMPFWGRTSLAALTVAAAAATVFATSTAPVKTQQQQQLEALQAKSSVVSARPTSPAASQKPGGASPSTGAEQKAKTDSSEVSFIGDSVTVAASDVIRANFPESPIQAHVGQQMWDVAAVMGDLEKKKSLGRIVVIALGTNGTFTEQNLEQVLSAAGKERKIVFVTAYGSQDWIPDANAKLRAFAQAHPEQVHLAQWDQEARKATDMAADGVHPGPQGAQIWVDTVAAAIRSFSS